MGRFDFNPTEVSAGFPVFDKGAYQFVIGEPKSFYKAATDPAKKDNYGVRYVLKVNDGVDKDKKFIQNCFMHTPESAGFSKQFMMAALGYKKDEEKRFDEEQGGQDWSYDPDNNSCGDGWHQLKGHVVEIEFDTPKIDATTGDKQNKVIASRPI